MKYLRRTLWVVAFSALSLNAWSFKQTGGELLQRCTDRRPDCRSYIEGVVDTLTTLAGWGYLKSNLVCIPENVNSQQVAEVVTKYLRDNPELKASTANKSVLDILSWTFP